MRNSDTLTIKFDTNPSPWRTTFVELTFNKNKIQTIVDKILCSCKNKTYSASYMYDYDIDLVLKNHHNKSMGSIRPLLQAIHTMIVEQQPENTKGDWHNEYTAAARSLYTMISYSTPGFVEAQAYNSIYST